jgi:hypothetical protein
LVVEKLFEELATEFDGENPVRPLVWGASEMTRANLKELAGNV